MNDWRHLAISLWGENYARPMADVLGIAKRTVERWKVGAFEPKEPAQVEGELRRLINLMPKHPRIIGDIACRVARGETLDAIWTDYELREEACRSLSAVSPRPRFLRAPSVVS
jgi:hypothetical protein